MKAFDNTSIYVYIAKEPEQQRGERKEAGKVGSQEGGLSKHNPVQAAERQTGRQTLVLAGRGSALNTRSLLSFFLSSQSSCGSTMPSSALGLAFLAFQLCPAVLGGAWQRFAVVDRGWPLFATKVENFQWENCGPSSEPAGIKSLSVSPDPVVIPGDVTVSACVYTSIGITSPLKAVVTLEKRLGEMWLKIPCVEELGSCTYDDICAKLDAIIPPGQPCPEPLLTYGIPCHCPFKAGTYNLPSSEVYIPDVDLPSFLTNGDYRIQVVLSNGDQELSCSKISFSLHSGKWWLW
nr:PREDICTED: ganglioside GM2 activator [Anolis carolinensis]|eukprot:XP_003217536.1 PREDICTED: ganglioside GM2 activator [Anolis carolinensis]